MESNGHLKNGEESGRINEAEILQKVFDLLKRENLMGGVKEGEKVIRFKQPKELQALLNLDITDEGLTTEKTKELLEKVVRYSVRTQHPHFYNQFYGSVEGVGLAAAWLTEALNTNVHAYEVAPVFAIMELFVTQKMVELYGWEAGDGIFAPGGSMSNMYAMLLARHRHCPSIKQDGISGRKPLIAFVSDQSHYSFKKAAVIMGLGEKNVVKVSTDSCGRMLPEALKEAVAAARTGGGDPFFVGATCGSTVLGGFDPLHQLADICEEEGLWLHADACVGGAAIFSSTHKHKLDGIQRADSIAWNAHKMLCIPLQCAIFLTKHKTLLYDCNCDKAPYLFQDDKCYDTNYDLGDKGLQCGRKADAFKLFLVLSVYGLQEIGKLVDDAFSAAEYLSDQVSVREGFLQVIPEAQCANTCFWYVPPSLRKQETRTQEWWDKLDKVAPEVKRRMVEAGTLMVSHSRIPSKNIVNCFRMTNRCHPQPKNTSMDFVLNEIERLGNDL